MKPAVAINNLGKKYKLGLVHQDMLVNKWINSFTRSFTGKSKNQKMLTGPSEIWALKEVSYDIMPGEVVGIIGRNGAGKSTLLKILSRITAPTEGEIRLQGRVASLLEVGTGFHAELTGRENIYLNGSILGMTKKEIDGKFDEIIDFAETEDFIDTPVKRYSSGMYVRLAFAVAAHLEPEILVVDEVLAVGDASFQNKCLGKMQNVAKEGRTVLFVSHQMGTLGKLCKTAFQLEQGRVVNSGPSDIVIAQYLQAMNENNLAEATFEPDDNKSISLQRIRILNHEGDSTTVLNRAKPFRMEITYRVNEDSPQAYLTFTLTTDDRVVRLCNSRDVDSHEGIYPRSKGIYTSIVEFPGGILNVGNYSADIGLFKSRKMLSDQAKSPTFELVDVGDIGNYQTSQLPSKRGILAMHLPWIIEKID